MAIYHLSAKIFSRSKGESAVGKAAYRAGEDLYDITIDKTFNYAHRQKDVAYSEIMTPANVPDWVQDRQELWTQVEIGEKRKDAQLAREFNAALPCELSLADNKKLVREFIKDNFINKGMIADLAIHDADSPNPHAHIMLTMRDITSEGFGMKNRGWNNKDTLKIWRENWSKAVNKALAENGSNERVDHRSFETRKLDKEPTIHLGVEAHQMEKKGIKTRVGDYNRGVNLRNRARTLLKKSFDTVKKSPMEIWGLIKDLPQIKAIYSHLNIAPATPLEQEHFHEKMSPDIDNGIDR